jgi:hypothetical protein
VEIDWKGIARSARAISGGQGENLLLLVTEDVVDGDTLNGLIPGYDGEFPARGVWFPGPDGWMLETDGMPREMRPALEELAANFAAAGIQGTLTGAKPVGLPAWLRQIGNLPNWCAGLVYRQQAGPDSATDGAWRGDPALFQRVLAHLIEWAADGDDQLLVNLNHVARFPFDLASAKTILQKETKRHFVCSAQARHRKRNQYRDLTVGAPSYAEMALGPAEQNWVAIIDTLRAAIRTAPLDDLAYGMLHHHSWSDFTLVLQPNFDSGVYRYHPELWDQYVPTPCGIQILTDKHLNNAHNLDNWNTTRLDNTHYLVQAKDLGPWYGEPLTYYETQDPELLNQARSDFGDMLFTHETATRLGIS